MSYKYCWRRLEYNDSRGQASMATLQPNSLAPIMVPDPNVQDGGARWGCKMGCKQGPTCEMLVEWVGASARRTTQGR